MRDGFWCFQCPECLIGSAELNRLAEDHELLCEVCLEEGRGEISLKSLAVRSGSSASGPFAGRLGRLSRGAFRLRAGAL